jgi:hypothetical protein
MRQADQVTTCKLYNKEKLLTLWRGVGIQVKNFRLGTREKTSAGITKNKKTPWKQNRLGWERNSLDVLETRAVVELREGP